MFETDGTPIGGPEAPPAPGPAGPAGPAVGAMLESAPECPPGPDALVRLATLDPAELDDRDAVLLLAAWERQLRWAAAHGQRILARLVRLGLITTATRPD